MKRISSLVVAAGVLGLSACSEVAPIIDMGNNTPAVDTTYVATVEAQQQRILVVEEFTGATCPNCPAARDQLTAIANQNPGRVLPVEIHIFNFTQSQPAHGAAYDLRTEDGTQIGKTYYTVGVMPSAGISRVPFQDQMLLNRTQWAGVINNQLNGANPDMNLTATSNYDDATRTATIKLKVAYTKPVSKNNFITVEVLEDSIVDIQEYPTSFDEEYVFMHTLRDVITSTSGDAFLANMPQKEAGRVYERTIVYPVPAGFKPEHCKIVAFVHNNEGDSKEILQAVEVEMVH